MKKTIEKTSLYEIEFALQNDSPERIKELIMEYKSVKSEKFFGMKAIFLRRPRHLGRDRQAERPT